MEMHGNTNRHGSESTGAQNPLEAAVVRGLERGPAVQIPQDFAARVAAQAVGQPVRRRSPWAGFGLRIGLGSGVLLTLALFAFAPHTTPSLMDFRFDLELVALAELGLVGCVLTRVGLRE